MQINAQWELPFSQYWEVKEYYNPSFAGETDHISTTAIYRYQWTGVNNSPQRVALTADMPFMFMRRKHGAGVVINIENIDTLRNSLLAAQYSYKHPLVGGMFNIGVQAGIHDINYDAKSIKITDDILQNNQQRVNVNMTERQVADFNVGISWTDSKSYIGFSVMHLNQPRFYTIPTPENSSPESRVSSNKSSETNNDQTDNNFTETDIIKSNIPQTFNLIAGYNIGLFNSLEIQPMIRVLHEDSQTKWQTTLRLEYEKRFSGGFSWISDNGYSFFASSNISGFRFGYAYTMHNKGIGMESNGSHELSISYDFPLDRFKPKPQPHKSIRLL